MNNDLSKRAVVETASMPWISRHGIREKVLEDAGPRRTAIVHMPAGATYAVEPDGALDILVLDGDYGIHPTGMYVREPAQMLSTTTPCTLFVKQRPSSRAVTKLALHTKAIVFEPHGPNFWRGPLHEDRDGTVVLLSFAPGLSMEHHHHDDGEELFVLGGKLRDEYGTYGLHTWVRQPPNSAHSVQTTDGCFTLSFAHHLAIP